MSSFRSAKTEPSVSETFRPDPEVLPRMQAKALLRNFKQGFMLSSMGLGGLALKAPSGAFIPSSAPKGAV